MNDLPQGKLFRTFGARGSRLGDTVMVSPVMAWLRQRFPDCYNHWQIARRHQSAAFLWIQHELIDRIVISDCEEGMGPRDHEIAKTCHVVFNVMPQHPDGNDHTWVNQYNIWEETWRMTGLPLSEYASLSDYDKRAHLVQWFSADKQPNKTLCIWPSSNYGVKQNWHSRFPSYRWTKDLCNRLASEGWSIFQCGHPNDYKNEGSGNGSLLGESNGVQDIRHLDLFSQFRISLGCDLILGTDSGSTLALAAYESVPTIQFLTNHTPGHHKNYNAFASNGLRNVSMFGLGSCDNISIDEVVEQVKLMT